MSIVGVQYRYRELGRLRMGDVEGKRPVRLDTWRLTSPSADLLRQASALWGGEVTEWEGAPTEGRQFELTTTSAELPVLVPPQDIGSMQFFEQWSGGGIKRRCDGVTDFISGGNCRCKPEERACKPKTHLLVMLPQLPDIGVWRMTTGGYNAMAELPQTVDLLRQIAGAGTFPEASLAIESRTSKTDGETHHFVVPVLRLPFGLGALLSGQASITTGQRGRVPLPGSPELPADASFADEHEVADWGEAPSLPAEPGVSTDDGAGSIVGQSGEGDLTTPANPGPGRELPSPLPGPGTTSEGTSSGATGDHHPASPTELAPSATSVGSAPTDAAPTDGAAAAGSGDAQDATAYGEGARASEGESPGPAPTFNDLVAAVGSKARARELLSEVTGQALSAARAAKADETDIRKAMELDRVGAD